MVLRNRIPTVYTIILLVLLQSALEAKKTTKVCPIGFQLTYTRSGEKPICYQLKGPEKFTDTFKECSGNLYTAKLYDTLRIDNYSQLVLWTEYKSAYPGGPFIDVSYTQTVGSLLKSSFNVVNAQLSTVEDLCIVKDPVGNYTAERCDKEFYRYCFVEPYIEKDISFEGCEGTDGFRRFWSPKSICLSAVTGVGGVGVRATWPQSNEICEKRGGEILYSGWRYSNSPAFHVSGLVTVTYPLGVTYDASHNITVGEDREFMGQSPTAILPDVQNTTNETQYGALSDGVWERVNSSFVFFDLICEKEVETKEVILTVKIDNQNGLLLSVDQKVDKSNIYCYTDSKTFYPTPVEIKSYETLSYLLQPEDDGNYWCVHIDSKRFQVSQSRKVLWIREKESLRNTYAVELSFDAVFTFENVKDIMKIWKRKLKDYIYYSTKYYEENFDLERIEDPILFENNLQQFKYTHPELNSKEELIIFGMKIKKLYLDGKTALVHFQLNSTMRPVQPGWWTGIKVISMKPVHFCSRDGRHFVNKIAIGCMIYSCVGSFNDGVQVVEQSENTCIISSPAVPIRELNITISMPTAATIKPEGFTDNTQNNLKMDASSSEENSTEPDNSTTMITSTSTTPRPPPTPPDMTTVNSTEEETEESTTEEYTTETTTTETTTTETTTTETTTEIVTTEYTTTTTTPVTVETVATAIPSFPTFPTTTEEPATLPPEDQLQQVMDNLESLLNDTVTVDVIAEPFDRVDEFLSENASLAIPGNLLTLLDRIGNKLDLNGSYQAQTVRGNVALLVASAAPGRPVYGLRIAAIGDHNTFTDEAFEIIRDNVDANHLSVDSSSVVVHIPTSVANSSRRFSFVVFRNDRAFQTNDSDHFVNSKILSVNVENITQFRSGESIDIHFRPMVSETERNQTRSCAYWKFEESLEGAWSQDGCRFIPATQPGTLDICRCNHLTHFAEILVPRTVFSDRNEKALEIISIVGCCLSLFGIVMVGITAMLFRSWRRDFNNKIWLQLCISIFILMICFLIIVFVKFQTYDIGCMFTGILLHYSVIASFCWMLIAAVISYRRLVMVFTRDASHKLLRASAFAWGAPFAVVGILLSVDPASYSRTFEEMTPTGSFCYPSGLGLWLAVYTPIAVMLVANWTLFVLIVRSVFASTRIQRHGDSNEAIRCASVSCLLVFLFGLPWIFGLFASNVVAAYFFAVTATFQGFVLFIFFVVGNKKTRDLWLNKLKIKQTLKVPVTSSTFTNRSTGPGWRAGVSGTVEAKVSKPRSLSNGDDSRFS